MWKYLQNTCLNDNSKVQNPVYSMMQYAGEKIHTYMLINVNSISERTLDKLETVMASGEDNLFFIVFPFVTLELCTMYMYCLFKSKVL